VIDSQTFDYLVSKLAERQDELKEFVGRGTVANFDEYQKLCGVIQGLEFAKQVVTDLAKRLEKDDDDE
jgi:hypothetical protein